jgi:hypothetical protein
MRCISILLLLYILAPSNSFGQKNSSPKRDTTKITGDYVRGNKIVYDYRKVYKNGPPKSPFIKLDKFLDTSKMIHIFEGSNDYGIDYHNLSTGINLLYIQQDSLRNSSFLGLLIHKGKLYMSGDFTGFGDKYVAKIMNNQIVVFESMYTMVSDSAFALVDKDDIPLLQLRLSKGCNCIYLNGVFNTANGYTIIDEHGQSGHMFPKPFPLMTEQERNEQYYKYLKLTKVLHKWFQLNQNYP